ncbi:Ger(x)C family spore germination protein [Paenibacillus sp. CAU 1782]
MGKKLPVIILLLLLLPGCWSKYELTERGFVMGVAIDRNQKGQVELLTQIYRPSSPQADRPGNNPAESSINIATVNDTVMGAIRDIPIHLGRKAQWSHLRVILVGEQFAKQMDLMSMLDFFHRDHEPRSSVTLMIAKGKASKLLEKKPLIEQTTSQQLLRSGESSFRNTGKTLDTTLLDVIRQLKSPNSNAALAYVYEDKVNPALWSAAGVALLRDGKLDNVVPAEKVKGLLILRNQFHLGIMEVPCAGKEKVHETSEVLSLVVKKNPHFVKGRLVVDVKIRGEIAATELKCSTIKDEAEEKRFVGEVERQMEKEAKEALGYIQREKLDVIGIGNEIYSRNPKEWSKLKENWGQQFSEIPFMFDIKLKLITGGSISAKPLP